MRSWRNRRGKGYASSTVVLAPPAPTARLEFVPVSGDFVHCATNASDEYLGNQLATAVGVADEESAASGDDVGRGAGDEAVVRGLARSDGQRGGLCCDGRCTVDDVRRRDLVGAEPADTGRRSWSRGAAARPDRSRRDSPRSTTTTCRPGRTQIALSCPDNPEPVDDKRLSVAASPCHVTVVAAGTETPDCT